MYELSLAACAPEIAISLLALLRRSRPILRSEDDARIRLLTHIQSSGRRGASQVSAARELGMSDAGLSRLCDELQQSGVIHSPNSAFAASRGVSFSVSLPGGGRP